MPPPSRQLELLPLSPKTAAQRKEWIRSRLQGLEYRQAAREAKRQRQLQRRKSRESGHESEGNDRQMTIDEVIARQRGDSADLN